MKSKIMEKNCSYCGMHFTCKRNSRKYCSDNCKQMAYFKRNGLVLSGTTETSNVKYERPVNVKTVNVKYANSFSHRVKDEDQSSEKARVKSNLLTLDEKTMEAFIIRLIPAMERKIVQEMETVKQELNAKYESLIAKTYFTENDKIKDTVKQRCNPIAYTGTILSPYFTIAVNSHQSVPPILTKVYHLISPKCTTKEGLML